MSEPIILDVVQGDYEWHMARLGIPTTSRYGDILTPKTMKLSASSGRYARHLLAEWLVGEPIIENRASEWMERGTELEPEARDFYAFDRGVTVEEVGFIYRGDRRTGCSPDGLVGNDGGLEIKNPSLENHLGYLMDPATLVDKYRPQVQGSLYITGRAWWDLMSYSTMLPPVVERVEPDPEFFAALDAALGQFCDGLDDLKRQYAEHRQLRADGTLSPLPGERSTLLETLERSLEVAHG